MHQLYLTDEEKSALRSIDLQRLRDRVDAAISHKSPSGLYDFPFSQCGPYVGQKFRYFQKYLADFAKSKAARKRADTYEQAYAAGSRLVSAVREMQVRAAKEDKECELCRVSFTGIQPRTFSQKISIRIDFQWRNAIEDAWTRGDITFVHNVDMTPDYTLPQPARKPGPTQRERERQDELYRHWEHLHDLALQSVREYLVGGHDPAAIPKTFDAKPSRSDRYLNNFSCDFWRE